MQCRDPKDGWQPSRAGRQQIGSATAFYSVAALTPSLKTRFLANQGAGERKLKEKTGFLETFSLAKA